jgi:hypothetical protein
MAWGFVAAGAITAIGGVIASNNAEDAAHEATQAQSNSAAASNQLGQDQLAWDKQQYYDAKPLRDETSQASLKLMQQQGELAKQQGAIAADYDAYNKGTFRPLEQQIVSEAEGYDTPERRAAAQAAARADVEHAYDTANAGLSRQLARTGTTMGSGRGLALMQDASLAKAGSIAGATTAADRNVETMGHARMMDAANLGRNLPSAQATAAGTSTGASNSATNSGTAAVANLQAGIGAVNQGYAGALQGTMNAGQLYGQASRAYQGQADNLSGSLGAFGRGAAPLIGSWMGGLGGGGTTSLVGSNAASDDALALYYSDKRKKRGTGKKLSGKKALDGIERTPVHEGWKYDAEKGGPDDGRAHDGPMAQDVAASMGEDVAPGGTMIDQPSMNAHLMAGMQELSRRQKRIERKAA